MHSLPEKPLVLCIDDEELILKTLQWCLMKDFQVLTAQTSQEGLALFKQNHRTIKVVITDLKMPFMNGIELLKQIKQIDPHSVCLILSGQGDFEETLEAINCNLVYRYLQKPCDNSTLIEAVHSAVKAKQINDTMETVRQVLSEENRHLEQFYDQLIVKGGTPLSTHFEEHPPAEEIERIKRLSEIGMVTLKVAHDMRNKLLILSLGMESVESFLRKENFPEMFMNIVKKSIADMSDLLEEIYLFITQSHLELQPEEIHLKNFVSSCLPEIQSVFSEKNVQVYLHIPDALCVQTDPKLLTKVIQNLAITASESMVQGSFTISALERDSRVEISCSDTGSGMTKEVADNIFRPYATYKTGGSSIGLVNVKKLIEMQGGTIRVESAPGKGSQFTLSLPKQARIQ
jgi:signal transduction histidine kinase